MANSAVVIRDFFFFIKLDFVFFFVHFFFFCCVALVAVGTAKKFIIFSGKDLLYMLDFMCTH